MEIEARARQWMGDITIEIVGNMNALFELAENNGLSITDDLTAGTELIIDLSSDIITNKKVLAYYNGQIFPVTGLTAEDVASQQGGVGYMGVEIDFKVS